MLTPEEIAEFYQIAGKQKLLDYRLMKDEEQKFELARQYYDPANGHLSREIHGKS